MFYTSNYGTYKDITAPGNNIMSTLPGDEYGLMSGTSMASPVVTAIAALVLDANPSLTYTVTSGTDVLTGLSLDIETTRTTTKNITPPNLHTKSNIRNIIPIIISKINPISKPQKSPTLE